MKVLLDVFNQMPFIVGFKWEHDVTSEDLKNVYFSKWSTYGIRWAFATFQKKTKKSRMCTKHQRSLFTDHPNVKLFLTQAGLQTSEETILVEIPIIGFSMLNDQTVNLVNFVSGSRNQSGHGSSNGGWTELAYLRNHEKPKMSSLKWFYTTKK